MNILIGADLWKLLDNCPSEATGRRNWQVERLMGVGKSF